MSRSRPRVGTTVRSAATGFAVLLTVGCGGGASRTPAEKAACAAVLRDATSGLRTAEGSLSEHDGSAIEIDFEAISSSMQDDVKGLTAGKVRSALVGWASDYAEAARIGPTTTKGTQLIRAGATVAGAVCGN